MTISFDLLPIELQQSVVELRADGASEAVIQTLVTRTLSALALERNHAQVDVWNIGLGLRDQLAQISTKNTADIQTQFGVTNGMLVDLRTDVQEAGRGIAAIKKQWRELDQWRSRVEAALASVSEFRTESTEDRANLRTTMQAMDKRHGLQIDEIAQRLAAIEQLLEIAGGHEAVR